MNTKMTLALAAALAVAGTAGFAAEPRPDSSPQARQQRMDEALRNARDAIKRDAHAAGRSVNHAATETGHAVSHGAHEAGHAVHKGASEAGHAISRGAHKAGEDVKEHTSGR